MIDADIIENCRSFIGKTREIDDTLAPESAEKLGTLLQHGPGKHLPLCWHWAYFNKAVPPSRVGHDGHEALGHFLPDVPLPRRMWAAGEITVHSPLVIGLPARRLSTIEDVTFKEGRSGPLCFVTLRHDILQENGPPHVLTGKRGEMTERQTIVYREPGQPEAALRAPDDPVPDGFDTLADTTLMAYSAVTQNGHRIHWDRDFCREVENYPDLVVHGPLLATMLAGRLSATPGPCVFRFRALAPVFATTPVRIDLPDTAHGTHLQTANMVRSDGVTAMTASYERPK